MNIVVREELRDIIKDIPILMEFTGDFDRGFRREPNRVYVEDIENYAKKCTLGHSSRHVFWIR